MIEAAPAPQVCPALKDEEILPSFGHKHPRADLLVPGLRLVFEVKYFLEASQRAREYHRGGGGGR